MPRRGSSLVRSPLVLVVLAATLCVGMIAWAALSTRADEARATKEASAFSAPPPVTPPPLQLPIVAVVGDDSTSAADESVIPSARWTALLARSNDVEVRSYAAAGAGYVARGTDGRTFVDQVKRLPTTARIVFLFGGAADSRASDTALSRGVSRAISSVQAQAPGATIIVVGPATASGNGSGALNAVRPTIEAAASAFNVRFVDPVQQAWLSRTVSGGADLGADDEAALAQHFSVLVTQVTRSGGS